ncbi:MAG TPA: M12 family metallo-peptidase [Blastocatellia bacterium]|nr:M12 family metallo-peptidase [Blastocatellia bacterium]HNG33702.1 M12 family metallo-peptidase [Blastocatellia bacterium]
MAALVGLLVIVQSDWRVKAAVAAQAERAEDGVWKATGERVRERQVGGKLPAQALVWQLDVAALRRALEQAPMEGRGAGEESAAVVSLPLPEGRLQRFRVVDSPVLSPELAARHPQIKSYRGQGVDDPTLAMRCSVTPGGVSAWVTNGAQTVLIQPLAWFRQASAERQASAAESVGAGAEYVSYYGQDYAPSAEAASCLVQGDLPPALKQRQAAYRARAAKAVAEPVTLRTYRIAMATTAAYRAGVPGGDVAGSINTWLNAVNLILGKELAIKLMLAGQPIVSTLSDSVTDAALDNIRAMFKMSGVDPGTYDVAHLLGSGSGGNAYVGGLCETLADSNGPYKAGGVTLVNAGSPGNVADRRMLLHELGHQLGATHTYNANKTASGADCNSGRVGDTAYELGNGATIMSLGGNCAGQDVVTTRYDHFHAGSLEQITAFLDSYGGTCGTAAAPVPANSKPMVTATSDYVIPKLTPFTLSGTITDPDGQSLTYTWEQMDAGGSAFANPPYGDQAGDPAETSRPLFLPQAQPSPVPAATPRTVTQTFTAGGSSPMDNLPAIGRNLNFRLTARDNQGTGGGVGSASVRVGVAENAGPFFITSPNTAVNWTAGTQQTVTWEVNNTNNPPVNCTSVNIYFSSDGGSNFSLLATVPNTGTATVTAPSFPTNTARIKIEGVVAGTSHRFFDISDRNFSVNTGSCSFTLSPTSAMFDQNSYTNKQIGVTSECFWAAVSNVPWLTVTPQAGAGTGTVNYNVAQNTGAPRSGTITIGGATFTVSQAGAQAGLQFYPLSRPVRLLDTRAGQLGCYTPSAQITGNTSRVQPARGICDGLLIPPDAAALTGNITTVLSGGGFLTLYPSDVARPLVANSNYGPNEVLNNVFTVGLGASDGAFNIFVTTNSDVVVDVTGYYAPPGAAGGLYFHPLPTPVRLLETRPGLNGCVAPGAPLTGTGGSDSDPNLDFAVQGRSPVASPCNSIPASAQMLVGNATSVAPEGGGFLTIYPSDGARPVVASSNYSSGGVVNGPFAVKLGADGKFKIKTAATTHLIIDILGYYSEEATAGLLFNPLPVPVRLLETRADFPNFPLTGCTRPNAPIQGNLNAATHTQQAGNFCGLPASAQALVGNVSVVSTAGAGFLTLFPGNLTTAPLVATANYPLPASSGYNRHYFVGLSPADGTFKVLTQFTTDLIVDVSGYFVP